MDRTGTKKKNFIFIGIMAVLLLLQLACLFYYGSRKAGFHEDELYTYYSTNKTAGLFVEDRHWLKQEELKNDFVVLPGEQFRYGVVKQMQSWDVHPPFYYYLIHTVSSLFPGVFSKWIGIGVNLAAYVGCFLLLSYGSCLAAGRHREKDQEKVPYVMAFLTCLMWGFSSAVISGVMFIRMYQWLTLFVLACLVLHLRALQKQRFRFGSFFLPLGITVFLGFLTQYYYIIFHFFLGAGFCFLLLKWKKIKELICYVLICGGSFLLAVCYYPASLSHIFRGYRGTEAVSAFGDASNTVERLRFFLGLFDDYVMNGTLIWWLLIICLLAVTAGYLRRRNAQTKDQKKKGNEAVMLMLFASCGYFLTVAKTALLLGETSNRYQLPVYGIFVFLLLYGVWSCGEEVLCFGKSAAWRKDSAVDMWADKGVCRRNMIRLISVVMAAVILLINGSALKNGKVFFLYEEEEEIMAFVQEHRGETVVVLYNEAAGDKIWWLSDELMAYPEVYLASQGNQEPITDPAVTESERLLVYAADHENREKSLEGLLAGNDHLSSCRVVAEKGLWTLYELE